MNTLAHKYTFIAISILLWLQICAPETHGQDFVITHSQPDNWAHSVADTTIVSFFFSKSLPFNTDFYTGFTFAEPRGMLTIQGGGVLLDLDSNRKPRIVRFTMAHKAQADYTWVVYGIECNDRNHDTNRNPVCRRDETLAEPFVLNYSTTSSTGTRSVSGSVAVAPAQPAVVVAAGFGELPQMLEAASFGRVDADEFPTRTEEAGKSTAHQTALSAAASDEEALRRTVILLLSAYSINDQLWTVRAAARVDESGGFTFSHAREQQFFPIAIRFKKGDNSTIEAFGIHDPDGSGVARSIDLRSTDASDVAMQMYAYEHSTSGRALARSAAGVESELGAQAVLQEIVADDVNPFTGEASTWTLRYRGDAGRRLRSVVDPVAVRLFSDFTVVPRIESFDVGTLLDSDDILALVEANGGEAYRAAHGDETRITMRLGASSQLIRPSEDVFWRVTYEAPGVESIVTYLHPETGDFLDLVDTGIESDLPVAAGMFEISNYPNPFAAHTNLTINVANPTTATIAVYDVLGRKVWLRDDVTLQSGVNTNLLDLGGAAPGVYFVRVQSPIRTATTRITLSRD